jgi:hypothetical protein
MFECEVLMRSLLPDYYCALEVWCHDLFPENHS